MRALRIGGGLLLALLAAASVQAQPYGNGSIVANSSGGGCALVPPACAVFSLANATVTTLTLQVSGTYSGTLAFEASADPDPLASTATWFSLSGTNLADGSSATGTTGTGQFSFPNSGLMSIRVRATAFASGTAVISAVRGYASARWLTPFLKAVTVSQGTLTADAQAISTSATWNSAGTTFTHWKAVITDTASAAGSLAVSIKGGASGTTNLFSLDKTGAAVFNGSVQGGGLTVASGSLLSWGGGSRIAGSTDGFVTLSNNGQTRGITAQFSAVPTIGTCGTTGVITTDSTDTVGEVTVGASGTLTSCSVNFGATWTKAPRCTANVSTATAANTRAIGITTSTTVLTMVPASAFVGSDKVWWQCWAVK